MRIASKNSSGRALLCIVFLGLWSVQLHAQTLDDFINSAVRSLTNSLQQQQQTPPPSYRNPPPAPKKRAANPLPAKSTDVAAAQALLNSLGYDAGPVDGLFGRKTKEALNRFQRDRGLPLTDSISSAALQALVTATQNSGYASIPEGPNAAPESVPTVLDSAVPATPVAIPIQAEDSKILQNLLAPPSGLSAWNIRMVDGLPAFMEGYQLASFIDLIMLRQVPDTLERNECALLKLFFTDEAIEPYAARYNCNGKTLHWLGSDEFARADMRRRFYEEQVPRLMAIVPQLPVSIAIVDDIRLDQFNSATSSFPLVTRSSLLETTLETRIGQSLQFHDRSRRADEPPTIASASSIPVMQLPMADADQAREFIGMVNSWVYSPGQSLAETGQRMMKRVAVVEFSAFDPTVRRLDIRLRSLGLYDLDLSQKYYDFPVKASAGSVVADGTEGLLAVPEPVELNGIYIALRKIQQFGENTPQDVWENLAETIRWRDIKYYEAQDRDPTSVLSYDEMDARRPFFAKNDYQMPDSRWPLFREWAHAYAAGLPETVQYHRNYINYVFNPQETYTFVALPGGMAGQNFQSALSEIGLQPDQVLEAGDILIALPNRIDFYRLEVPGASLTPYEGEDLELRMLLRSQPQTEIIALEDRDVLLIRLDPISLTIVRGDETVAERDFKDVPRLDSGFTAGDADTADDTSILSTARPISGDLINLLLAGTLDHTDPRYGGLVLQRWQFEQKNRALGGNFFAPGKRQPTELEARDLAEQFAAWAQKRVPALPAEITFTSALERPQEAVAGALKWEGLSCIASALNQDETIRISANLRLNGAERLRREQAMAGMGAWTAEDELRLTARELERVQSQFVTRISCDQTLSNEERYAIPLYAVIPSLLPTPPEGARSADLRFRFTAISYASEQPHYLDLLPPEMLVHIIENRRPAPGDYIKLDAEWLEVVYRDAEGNELARRNPDPAFSLDHVVFQFSNAVETHSPAESGEPYGPDIIGIRLGMTFDEAEALIRLHMPVGVVLDGVRAHDGSIESGTIRPATSGKLFISEDRHEFIALLDEAPAVTNRVLAAWRRLYLEPNQLQEGDVITSLEEKYGTPSMSRSVQVGIRNFWATPAGNDCGNNYTYGGQRPALSSAWTDGSGQMQFFLADGRIIPDAVLPAAMLDPLSPGFEYSHNCGPVFTAELSFDGSRTLKAGYQTQELDWIEQIITDVGPYIKAYMENRQNLTGASAGTATGKTTVKF